jgi:hypothetical protein
MTLALTLASTLQDTAEHIEAEKIYSQLNRVFPFTIPQWKKFYRNQLTATKNAC